MDFRENLSDFLFLTFVKQRSQTEGVILPHKHMKKEIKSRAGVTAVTKSGMVLLPGEFIPDKPEAGSAQ